MPVHRIAQRVELLLADAHAALREGDHQEAHVLARAVLALDPGNADAEGLIGGADQRMQLTIMFCDLVGSTPLADRLDPEEISAILREYRRLCTSVIRRYGGFIDDCQGDGLLVRFGYPWVHEDDARRAVLAGLEIVRAIREHPRELHVRIAVHTGVVVLDGDEVVGATPNEAARLQGIAPPDSVVISDATHALVCDHFGVRSMGAVTLRGVSRPIEAFTVVDERASEPLDVEGGLTPLTGRGRELEIVRALWRVPYDARRSAPAALLISGVAGIGKSRLAREGVDGFAGRLLSGSCSSYHATTSLHPFVGVLESTCDIAPSDDAHRRLEKLRARLPGRTGDLPLLAAALSIPSDLVSPPADVDPSRLRIQALHAAAELLRSASAREPALLLIEDLHWADESSLALFSTLLTAPCPDLAILMTARPDFGAPWPDELVQRLALEPLPAAELERMACDIAGGAGLDAMQRRTLVDRSDGIPLFLEELVRSGSALGSHADPADALHAAASGIPAALRDPLLARLVLPGVDLALVQTAATIGRDVDCALLQQASTLDDKHFQSKLANLVTAGLVHPCGEGRIRFHHELVRNAAYETQLRSVRRRRHSDVAELLLAGCATPRTGDAAAPALHLERAERYGEAIEALLAAARTDQALGAHDEARPKLTRVLALIKHLPPGQDRLHNELSARQMRSFSATVVGGYSAPETAEDHARCVELCETLDREPELLPSLILSSSYYCFRGDLDEADRVCATIDRIARGGGAPPLAAAAVQRGVVSFLRGRFDEAYACMTAFVEDPWGHTEGAPPSNWPLPNDPLAAVMSHIMLIESLRGEEERSRAMGERALHRAVRLQFPFGPFTMAYVNSQLAIVRRLEGDHAAAGRLADEMLAVADRHGFALWTLAGTIERLLSLVHAGEAAALERLETTIGHWRQETSAELWVPYWLTEVARAHAVCGRRGDACASLDEALTVAAATGSALFSAETLRIRGTLRCEGGDLAGGRTDLRAAAALARAQNARLLERRAAVALQFHGGRQTLS